MLLTCTTKRRKRPLNPCFVFALYTTFCFQFLSLVIYKLSTFAVVVYTYDATESHILKRCLKKKLTLICILAPDMVFDYRSIAFSKTNIVEAIFRRPER